MSLTANVVANTPITSVWGNEIRDRTVQQFTTAAQRTSQWTSPPVGAVSHTADHPGILWIWNGTSWAPANAGVIAYAQITSNSATYSTLSDVAGLALTFTAVAGVLYRVTFRGVLTAIGTANQADIYVREGSTILSTIGRLTAGGGAATRLDTSTVPFTPTAGAHTYKISAQPTPPLTMAIGASAFPGDPGPAGMTIEVAGSA